LRGIRLQWLWC